MRKLFLIMMTVLACTWSLSAQTRTIHGTVLDAANDEPLIGASVLPIGGGNGASADIDGKFTLRVPANVKQAKVTYVGYEPVTVNLVDGMVVKMKSSATDLEDFVVVAYGTASKESLTGSVAVVGSKEISRRPVTSVTAALEGNAPGVQISNTTGGPGSSPSILIRGINTITGTTAPLYVVDGILYDGSVVSINPADVESISVLKDAASCALYGAKGANGVILITTRTAKDKGKVDVTLNINVGTYNRGIPFYETMNQHDWMNTRFASLVNGAMTNNATKSREQAIKDVKTSINNQGIIGAFSMYDIYTPEGVANAGDYIFGDDGFMNPGVERLPGYWDTDWNDVMARHGFRQAYTATATAATDKMNIFASLGYTKENGYIILSDYERFNARFNGNFMPTKYFKMGLNLDATYSDSETDNVDGGSANPFSYTTYAPFYPYYQHEANGDIKLIDGLPFWNTSSQNTLTEGNLAYVTRTNIRGNENLSVTATAYAELTLPYGFSLNIKGSMFRRRYNYFSYGSPIIGAARGFGRLSRQFLDYKTHNFYQTLNWAQDYGRNHVDVMLNHENYDYYYDEQNFQKKNQLFPGVLKLSNFEEVESNSSSASANRREAYLGRVRYNYDQKYFAEASVRRDGTSRFAKDVRWGTFWSVGASWVISKEKFMEALPWVDYAKLRASYGTVGSDYASNYAYYDLYSLYGDLMGGQVVAYPSLFGNNKLKWESTNTLDIALEGNLFNNRFNFSVGYFLKYNADLIYNMVLPSSLGTFFAGAQRTQAQNVCTMQNWGWELAFGGTLIDNGDWRWTAKIDATFIKNKMTKLAAGNVWSVPRAMIEGKSRYELYTYDWVGVDQMTGRSLYAIEFDGMHEWETQDPETLKWYWDESEAKKKYDDNIKNAKSAGEYVEINGKPYTTNTTYATRGFRGSTLPLVYGSFGTQLSWKDLHLDILLTYSLGGKLYNDGYSAYMGTGQSNIQQAFHVDLLKAWTAPPAGMTDNSPNRIDPKGIPQVNTIRSQYDNAGSDRWLCTANFMTLKNIALSYDLPRKWTNAMLMQGLTVGFTVENAFSVTARKGINPSYNYSGGQNANYRVQARTFNFNVTARF